MVTLPALVEEIQELAAAPERCDLPSLLLKCRLAATRLNSRLLEDWIRFESEGYSPKATVPDYRITRIHFYGIISFPGRGTQELPVDQAIPAKVHNQIKDWPIRNSIASLEDMAKSDQSKLAIPFSDLARFCQNAYQLKDAFGGSSMFGDLSMNASCIDVRGKFSLGALSAILHNVRSRALDFAAALEKNLPAVEAGNEAATVNQMVQNYIYGSNHVTVISGSHNFVNISGIVTGDFESLKRHLTQGGVPPEDAESLRAVLKAEPRPIDGDFGPKTKGWIDGMVDKARAGVWDVSIKAGTALLTEALKKFLGL